MFTVGRVVINVAHPSRFTLLRRQLHGYKWMVLLYQQRKPKSKLWLHIFDILTDLYHVFIEKKNAYTQISQCSKRVSARVSWLRIARRPADWNPNPSFGLSYSYFARASLTDLGTSLRKVKTLKDTIIVYQVVCVFNEAPWKYDGGENGGKVPANK